MSTKYYSLPPRLSEPLLLENLSPSTYIATPESQTKVETLQLFGLPVRVVMWESLPSTQVWMFGYVGNDRNRR